MKKLFLLLLLAINTITNAQNYTPSYIQGENNFIEENATILDLSGWFIFNKGTNVPFDNFISEHKSNFGLGVDDNLELLNSTTDDLPFTNPENQLTHNRYIQKYKGVEVEFTDFFIHRRDNQVVSINCKVAENLNIDITPIITENVALTNAINNLGSNNTYSWLVDTLEMEIKEDLQDINATYFPTGKLILAKNVANSDYSNSEFTLCWKFEIYCSTPDFHVEIYVNATNGSILKISKKDCNNGTASLLYYGNRPIDTRWRGFPYKNFVLNADDNSRNITTKYVGNGFTGFNGWSHVTDKDDSWPSSDERATTPHWCASETWDFFKSVYNRNGCKNNGRNVNIWANSLVEGAEYTTAPGADLIKVGDYQGNYMSGLDVIGHEFTHGVTQHTANLVYEKESGALNESFSDIFGFMVERYTQGGSINDWLLGEDAYTVRSMSNPPLFQQPTVYNNGTYWFNVNGCTPTGGQTGNDQCGVHTNSGVQNYWFYLLTQGSVGAPAGTVNNISVNGIGAESAAKIAYYNLTNYLGCNSSYLDAANGSAMAAYTLFGNCSNEWKQTVNAWSAVGIGNPYSTPTITGPSPIYIINSYPMGSMPKVYTANGTVSASGYNWSLNNNSWTNTITGFIDNTFSITDFNNNYTTSTLQVDGACESATKVIKFHDLIGWNDPTINGSGAGQLSPNPARNNIRLAVEFENQDNNAPWNVNIFSMNSSSVFQETYQEQLPEEIDISNLVRGEYVVVVQNGVNLISIQFIKE